MAKKKKLYQTLLGDDSAARSNFSDITIDQWLAQMTNPFTTWSNQGTEVEEVIAQLGGAVRSNGIVFALVLARAMVFSEARFLWRRYENGRPQDLFRTNELEILERPWAGGTTGNLLTRMEFDASAAGNAYIRRVPGRPNAPAGELLNVMRPEWVSIVIGSQEDAETPQEASDAEVVSYIYDPPNGDTIILEPQEVAHYAPIPDPDRRFLGLSWITPVLEDVIGDQSQTIHKNKFFENAATPNMVIKFDASVQRSRIEEFAKMIDARHAGSDNAYKTLYIGGGGDPVTVGADFREMDFAVTQGKGEARLASASGVPPSWVGFSEGLQGSALNAGNFTAARRRFADGTMRPLWRDASASLETILSRPAGRSSHLWYDDREIPFLREDKDVASQIQGREASTIVNLTRDGFTPESAIEAVKSQDWSLLVHDERFISVQLQTLAQANKDTVPVSADEDDDSGDNNGSNDNNEGTEQNSSRRRRRRRKGG